MNKLRLGVLASGRGSNLQAILDACGQGDLPAEVAAVISDKKDAFALERARKAGVPAHHLNPAEYQSKAAYEQAMVEILGGVGVQLICLAGYMRLVGPTLLQTFTNRILNIHPSLLPAFPGLHAHQQALDYGVKVSGCTVHFVDEGMDSGPIIAQACVPVLNGDSEDTLSERILQQEHRLYPEVIRLYAEERLQVRGRNVIIL